MHAKNVEFNQGRLLDMIIAWFLKIYIEYTHIVTVGSQINSFVYNKNYYCGVVSSFLKCLNITQIL